MTGHPHSHHHPSHDELHPRIYEAMVGFAVWFVLSIWALFNSGGYEGLALAMISLFFLVVVGVPVLLWLTWWRHTKKHGVGESPLRDWMSEEFRTWTGSISGKEAMLQILPPIAAVSIGITVFGLVFYFDVPHAGY